MSAVDRAERALNRPRTTLPWRCIVDAPDLRELVRLAKQGQHHDCHHTCEECGECLPCESEEPCRCEHGHVICEGCWPAFCRECSDDLEDDRQDELFEARKEHLS